jgi:hypothetical protein
MRLCLLSDHLYERLGVLVPLLHALGSENVHKEDSFMVTLGSADTKIRSRVVITVESWKARLFLHLWARFV